VNSVTVPYGRREKYMFGVGTSVISDISPSSGRKFNNIMESYDLRDGTMNIMLLSLILVKLKIENPSAGAGEQATMTTAAKLVAHNSTTTTMF
jgi:hypothetical protein